MSSLPYHDTKPRGAPDFYFAINATFRFIRENLGEAEWIRYLEELGRDYYAPVNAAWREEGLPAVARYWKEFFEAEPGAEVEVESGDESVAVRVRTCPAIHHLRRHRREIVPSFCQHCYHLNHSRAQAAGLSMTVEGGNGSCTHTYHSDPGVEQDLSRIATATS